MNLWRISRHRSLNGQGGRLFPGRWNNPGAPVVYLADSPGGAMVEVLVHLQVEDELMPPSYTLLQVVVPDELEVPTLEIPAGEGWKTNLKLTRKLGDAWLRARETALVRVYDHAVNVLESSERALLWLNSPKHLFSERTPMDMLQTEVGARSVEEFLGQIDYGIFA